MKVKVTKDAVTITEQTSINEGEVCVNFCYFDLPECFDGLSVTAVFNNIPVPITDNWCNIPSLKKGTVVLGVYAYTESEGAVTLMYSPKPTSFYVGAGSFTGEIGLEEIPSVSEMEQYCKSFSQKILDELSQFEKKKNKVMEITDASTDEEYPSAKAVFDLLGNIEISGDDSSSGNTASGGGMSSGAVSLLIQILKSAVFSTNVSGKIAALETALATGGGSGSGGDSSEDLPGTYDDITVADGVMTIVSVGSEISVTNGTLTIL